MDDMNDYNPIGVIVPNVEMVIEEIRM